MFEPMLAAAIDEVPASEEYLLETKLDGWRALAGIGDVAADIAVCRRLISERGL
jgi:ATP-dependent DNA ligase